MTRLCKVVLLSGQLFCNLFHDLRAKIGQHAVHDAGNRAASGDTAAGGTLSPRVPHGLGFAAAAAMAFGASSTGISACFAASTTFWFRPLPIPS